MAQRKNPFGGGDLTAVSLPAGVEQVLARLQQDGWEAWVVGGAARNLAWGLPVEDWDVTTDAPLSYLLHTFGDAHPGRRFGTVFAGQAVEVTMMRVEAGYSDRRHPDAVHPAGAIEEDLLRRDFTVNAVAFNHRQVAAVPYALEDLAKRRWRAVGDPEARFREDGLRLMRLARFVMTYGGLMEANTFEAAWRCRSWALAASRERRWQEMQKMLLAPPRTWQIPYVLGLLPALGLPHRPLLLPRWPHPQGLAARLLWWLWAGYQAVEPVKAWLDDWPIPRHLRRGVAAAARHLGSEPDPATWARVARRREPGGEILGEFARAAGVKEPDLTPIRLAVDGHDLRKAFGIEGASVGRLLRELQALVEQEPSANRKARLLEIARARLDGQNLTGR